MSEPKTAEVKVRKMLWCNNPWCGGGRYCKFCKDACTPAPASPPAETVEGLEQAWEILSAIPAINDLGSQYQEDIQAAILTALKDGRSAVSPAHPVSPSEGEAVAWVSPEQFAALITPEPEDGGQYIPVRKSRAGLFTQPLYTHPASDQSDTERMREALKRAKAVLENAAVSNALRMVGAHEIIEAALAEKAADQ